VKKLIEVVRDFSRGDPTGFVCGPAVWSKPDKVEVSWQPAASKRVLAQRTFLLRIFLINQGSISYRESAEFSFA
jgi:hypothetical protein